MNPEDLRGQQLVNHLLRYSASSFSAVAVTVAWLDEEFRFSQASLWGVEADTFSDYYDVFEPMGRPDLLLFDRCQFGCLSKRRRTLGTPRLQMYDEYIQAKGFCDQIDFLLWDTGQPIASLSVLGSRTFEVATDTLEPFRKFAESSLLLHPEARRRARARIYGEEFGLTGRESQVVELIRGGASNGAIAELLRVSLATVKTHVVHALDKMAVTSRAAMMAKIHQL